MLSSINPLGERARGQRFAMTVAWYVAGSLLGGALAGGAAGAAGSWLPPGRWRAGAIVAVALVGAVLDLTQKTPPSLHRQVDENWLTRYRGWVYGVGFGFQLGLGVATIITTASVYSLLAVVALLGSIPLGLVLGAAFGMARALVIVLVVTARDPGSLRRVMRELQGRLPVAVGAIVAAQLLIAGVAVMALA